MSRKDLNEYIRKNYEKKSDAVIASEFGVNENAIRLRRQRMGLKRAVNDYGDMVSKDIALQRYRSESQTKDKKYKALIDQIAAKDLEIEALMALKNNDVEYHIDAQKRGKASTSEATAFLVASDWHCEEIVASEKVNGLNFYNPDEAKKRAEYFFVNGLRLVKKEAQDVKITKVVVPLLGDFISSNIHDELLENCAMRPMDAMLYAYRLIASGIDYMLENSDFNFLFVGHVGNHSRITKKVHVSTEQGNSLETFAYAFLKEKYAGNPRVDFIVAQGYHTYLTLYENFTVRLHHGHSISYGGGVGGITIPVNKKIAQWNIARRADLDVFGHFHQFFDGQKFVVNGSLIGYNSYALSIGAAFEKPRQAFFLIDAKHGKTITAPIILEQFGSKG
jgi:hypothetical protein